MLAWSASRAIRTDVTASSVASLTAGTWVRRNGRRELCRMAGHGGRHGSHGWMNARDDRRRLQHWARSGIRRWLMHQGVTYTNIEVGDDPVAFHPIAMRMIDHTADADAEGP